MKTFFFTNKLKGRYKNMKLEALFKSQNNKLVQLSNEAEISLDGIPTYKAADIHTAIINADFFAVEIPWSTVELDDGIYNEEFLAELRDFLKKAESRNQFGFIIPLIDKNYISADEMEAYINAFNHTARRIKDCVSLIGISLPSKVIEANQSVEFMETLAIKHAQYLYFVEKSLLDKINQSSEFGIVAY